MSNIVGQIDRAVTAQVVTALAAIAALFVAPALSRRNERLARRESARRAWLDGLLDDIAHFSALESTRISAAERYTPNAVVAAGARNNPHEAARLNYRIRLRLNFDHPAEAALDAAIMRMAQATNSKAYLNASADLNNAYLELSKLD